MAHEQRPPWRIEVVLAKRDRLLDAEPGAPKHDDQRPQASAVAIVGSAAHHRDDLLDGRRVGGIELPLVAGQARRGARRCAPGPTARTGRTRSLGSPAELPEAIGIAPASTR